ncbi:DUF1641 domain-containing protein [Mycolicibacterium sp.]|uniref:DUF1641 domain-containing protein n=1 Tax=Mycolicibacterium sp. TaxID=2320850 RepID=UPI001A3267BB|nr:DUF1641 domain-containing protein [Mycolicibacterium sp.]MBJ7339455.1 DUF1641 domain-containing protein [Mycolicibacterium sp.]
MTANGQALDVTPADRLREKLDDPRVAESLNSLLEHADLLAILVSGLDAMVRRSDTLSDNLTSAIGEFKGDAKGAAPSIESMKAMAGGFAQSLGPLFFSLVGAAPAINELLASRLTDPEATKVLAKLGDALVEGKVAADQDRNVPKGFFGILRAAKDPDVGRGVGFLLQVAKAFGRELR